MLVEVEVLAVVGLGTGAGVPGESIIPANAEMDRTEVTIATAHVRRNLLTFVTSNVIHYFVTMGKIQNFLHHA
jgi:hypothetical protein